MKADYADDIGVAQVLMAVPCRKPKDQEWCRVHDSSEMQAEVLIFEDKINKDPYYIHPKLRDTLGPECIPTSLHLTVTRQNAVFLWPCRICNPDEKVNLWHSTRRDAIERAKKTWVRVKANQPLGYYDVFESDMEAEPKWPDLTFPEIMRLCFNKQIIESMDHAVIKALLGQE